MELQNAIWENQIQDSVQDLKRVKATGMDEKYLRSKIVAFFSQ